jgi:hypothetical protein
MRVGRPIKALPQPACDYCGGKAQLSRVGDDSYPYREDHGVLWICRACDAWIGTYARSRRNIPLGRLANAELRQAKAQLHAALEPLVTAKMRRDGCNAFEARAKGLRWIVAQMGLGEHHANIHALDANQCRQALDVIQRFLTARSDGSAGTEP